MKLIGVYGAGGCGRGIMPLVRQQAAMQEPESCSVVFVDDAPQHARINGHDVLDWHTFCSREAAEKSICLAVADTYAREKLSTQCRELGIGLYSVKATNVVVMDDAAIREGSVLSPFVTITSNVKIGRCFHANLYSYVEHDCVVGNFVTFAPKVACNGNVIIEDHVYIGAGAVLRQGSPDNPLVVGRGAVVGMGAIVTKNVPPGATVVGNPARLLRKAR